MARLSIAVVGGGIGGTAAALSMLRAGFDVHVYEQAKDLGEVGAGVQISPNASRILHRLGLAEALTNLGVGAPHYQMHRADVLRTIASALPPDRLHVGHRLTGLIQHGDRVEAHFENGVRVDADVLVGADGIHSAVRRILFGAEQPRFTGCMCYRGLVPAERLAHLDLPVEAQIWMGPGKHFINYYVQSKRLVNFVGVIDQDTWTKESWTDRGDIADARAAFAEWHPQVRAILSSVEETFVWGLFDRSPMERWSVGRATLLGDACHAMLPFMAQGAAQAIEDGATLATCLANVCKQDVPAALRRYELSRLPRTTRVQSLSAINKTRFHLPDGPEQVARDMEMAKSVTDWSLSNVAWLYGHDAGDAGTLAPECAPLHETTA